MPRPVPWDWARSRLVPLLARPGFDRPDEPIVRATAGPGCAVEFGLDLGGVFAIVDRQVAERWECTPAQLLDTSMETLAERLGRLRPQDATVGAVRGRLVRMLDAPPGLAASTILLRDELVRLFGQEDQVFIAPGRSRLISFPLTTPAQVVVESVLALELDEAVPLLLDPFVLLDGELHWQSGPAEEHFGDHPGWREPGQPGEL
ncbi:MAG TPA: hypothetical protein VM305_11695 [Candidatus Limnocylindrales bacterium]|nr:hypothetical protein [Candidatus Limnocylindrales bacterium]